MAFIEFFFIVIGLYVLFAAVHKRRKSSAPLPPGPKGLAILGNIKDLPPPGKPEHEHWINYRTSHGPITAFTVMGQTLIIMHDRRMVVELMEKRGSNYSGRPLMKFANELLVFLLRLYITMLTDTFQGWMEESNQ
jgi:hypothetical protein